MVQALAGLAWPSWRLPRAAPTRVACTQGGRTMEQPGSETSSVPVTNAFRALVWRRAMVLLMLLWLMPMGVAGSEAATLPTDDLRIHLDASDTSKLFKTYDSGGKHSGTPADGEAVQVWDDEGDGIADIAFVYITDSARSPIYRSASSPMRHSCLDFDGIDDSLKAVTQDGLVEHPLSDFITASAFTLLIAFHPLSISDPE